MDLANFVGDVATVATVINFASGVEICQRIYKKGTSAECTPIPFMMGMVCSFLWFQYGIRKPDMIITTVNVIGFTLQTSFLFWFYLYTKPKGQLNYQIGFLLTGIFGLHFYLFYGSEDLEHATKIAGYGGMIAAIAFFTSPLALLARVIQTQCSECLPLPLIVSSFCAASLWTFYGSLVNDSIVIIPNGIASVITFIQLILLCVFPRKPQSDLQRIV